MVNVNKIRGLMAEHNYSQEEVAKALGISTKTLYLRMKEKKFGSDEMEKLIELFGIDDPASIFFVK